MKITKHGDKYKKEPYMEDFKCRNCGCEFSVKDDEYYTDFGDSGMTYNGLSTYTYSTTIEDRLVCSCPECHKIVKKTKTRTNYVPYTVTCSNVTGTKPASTDCPAKDHVEITCNSTK